MHFFLFACTAAVLFVKNVSWWGCCCRKLTFIRWCLRVLGGIGGVRQRCACVGTAAIVTSAVVVVVARGGYIPYAKAPVNIDRGAIFCVVVCVRMGSIDTTAVDRPAIPVFVYVVHLLLCCCGL